jgi:retron-type reverse transcriptase
MSRERRAKIIAAIRHERWPWHPVRRIAIPKRPGGTRPLGMPTWAEKVGQEVIQSILAAYDAPPWSRYRHGFRPTRGGHTARTERDHVGVGTPWCSAGDITGCCDTIAQPSLLPILRANLRDKRCLRLLAGALKAGDCAAWTSHPSRRGSPPGAIVSPGRSNLSMDRGDRFVQETLMPE